jgi:hypothetical protein
MPQRSFLRTTIRRGTAAIMRRIREVDERLKNRVPHFQNSSILKRHYPYSVFATMEFCAALIADQTGVEEGSERCL